MSRTSPTVFLESLKSTSVNREAGLWSYMSGAQLRLMFGKVIQSQCGCLKNHSRLLAGGHPVGLKPGSEPPAMGDTPVLLEGWRVYERTMVQRNRATLPAGRACPPHEVFIPRTCYQICRDDKSPSSHNCGLCIKHKEAAFRHLNLLPALCSIYSTRALRGQTHRVQRQTAQTTEKRPKKSSIPGSIAESLVREPQHTELPVV
ncbi:hypothetical protein CSKR_111069 [Clonorchis sinensis]|uniref:Uncharacterized protein n=1 Tax=Clonorchis sinensis TaxID=79923 RepID=A0A419QE34_CLOSI|nr:hypothetical protein CSKR_111069 [Clonorchis sinensis]